MNDGYDGLQQIIDEALGALGTADELVAAC